MEPQIYSRGNSWNPKFIFMAIHGTRFVFMEIHGILVSKVMGGHEYIQSMSFGIHAYSNLQRFIGLQIRSYGNAHA